MTVVYVEVLAPELALTLVLCELFMVNGTNCSDRFHTDLCSMTSKQVIKLHVRIFKPSSACNVMRMYTFSYGGIGNKASDLVVLQPFLPGTCEPVKKYTKYGVRQFGHVHTGPDVDADSIRVRLQDHA